ncbi:Uncharacterised protein [Vibrio cholerae]|nr:Uncharacterised protein [Vibrio cholerae]CSI50624.1 Uncharacterised protein [Vibrio cholerae]
MLVLMIWRPDSDAVSTCCTIASEFCALLATSCTE